jgi:hypothetical protein
MEKRWLRVESSKLTYQLTNLGNCNDHRVSVFEVINPFEVALHPVHKCFDVCKESFRMQVLRNPQGIKVGLNPFESINRS